MPARSMLVRAVLGLGLLGIAGAAGGLIWAWRDLNAPHAGWGGSEAVVDLPRNLGAGSLLRRLGRAGVLRHPRLLRAWLVLRGGEGTLRAGEYRFDRPASPLEVLERLRQGEVLLHPVTVPEGLLLDEVARRVEQAGLGAMDALLLAFRDPALVRDLDADASDLEGYLFPDTYLFARRETPEAIARAMVTRFREMTGPDYSTRAGNIGLTARQAVTLASLIEQETSLPEERRRISRVFHNRLKRAMPLQCDPTVLYALHRAGKGVDRLLLQHLEFRSPWNTYVTVGLPPGPICNPGRESLLAAVDPHDGDDLYFVAAPGGGHTFSRDLTAHQKAVQTWRRYDRSSR